VRKRTRLALAAFLALAGGLSGGGASAQAPASASFSAASLQGLAFGALLPGAEETIDVTDAARRAEVMLNGEGIYDVTLVLPSALVSPNGARLPLKFQANDGLLLQGSSGNAVPLNPLATTRVRLNPALGPTRLVLGGTAAPPYNQVAGRYTATIVIIVTTPGT
jgi:hypothetical protein